MNARRAARRDKARLHAQQAFVLTKILDKRQFHEAALAQRCCQNPKCPKPGAHWNSHHVVYEQELRKLGLPLYDPRNVLRLCRACHSAHHARTAPIPFSALTETHIAYARDVLGDGYLDYLRRRYPEAA